MPVEPKKIDPLFLEKLMAKRAGLPRCEKHPEYLETLCDPCVQAAKGPNRTILGDRPWEEIRKAEWFAKVEERHQYARVEHEGAREWSTKVRESPSRGRSLLLLGEVGVGKTYQAYGALKRILWQEKRISWVATDEMTLMNSMRPRDGVDATSVLERYQNVDILLIDDFGTAKMSEWVEEKSNAIISFRHSRVKPTILTSNLLPGDIKEVMGGRAASRLAEMCDQFAIKGDDWRRSGRTGYGDPTF